MVLAIRRVNNLPPRLSYVSTLPDVTHTKTKTYVVFVSIVFWKEPVLVRLKWLWKEPVVCLDHSRCSKWHPFAFTHARSRVCHWSVALSMMPWGIRS